jgi:hypothetical protein
MVEKAHKTDGAEKASDAARRTRRTKKTRRTRRTRRARRARMRRRIYLKSRLVEHYFPELFSNKETGNSYEKKPW